MSIELQKSLSAAWENDRALAVYRGRVDDAYELGFIAAWKISKAPATAPVMVDLEAGAKALLQGSTPWEQCTQEHRDYWRSQAKACAKTWGLEWK